MERGEMPENLYCTVVPVWRSTTIHGTPCCASSAAVVSPFRLPPTMRTFVASISTPGRRSGDLRPSGRRESGREHNAAFDRAFRRRKDDGGGGEFIRRSFVR